MRDLLRDLWYSARRLSKSRAFSLAAVTTLAVGIGGVATMFALVNAIVIQPLPYPQSHRLISVAQAAPGLGRHEAGLSSGTYFHYRAHARSIETLSVYKETILNLVGPDANDGAGECGLHRSRSFLCPGRYPRAWPTLHVGRRQARFHGYDMGHSRSSQP